MATKEDILATSEPESDAEFEYFDLNEFEKGQIQALAELVQQARLAQDVIYTNLVQSVAARYELNNRTIDIDMQHVFEHGASDVKLRASKPKEEEANETSQEEAVEQPQTASQEPDTQATPVSEEDQSSKE